MTALSKTRIISDTRVERRELRPAGTMSDGRRRRLARRQAAQPSAAKREKTTFFNPRRLGAAALPASARRAAASTTSMTPIRTRRAFLYTRYSTREQEVKSEQRQIADLRDYALKNSLQVEDIFSDRALTGTSMIHRARLQALLAAARLNGCDVVLVEDLDRLSRHLPDLFAIFYELQALKIELHDLRNGKLELIHIVMRGYMSEEGRLRFLAMSKSGKREAAGRGEAMAKPAFGFMRHAAEDGILVKHPENAKTVLWIFEQIAAGVSASSVARLLTEKKVLPPEQARQALDGNPPVTIKPWHGNSVAKISRNHVYLGIVSWGRQRPVYDYGRRKVKSYEMTDEATWIVYAYDHMRIVSDTLFARSNLRLGGDGFGGVKNLGHFLLTEKSKCGKCGAPLAATGDGKRVRYRCTRHSLAGDGGCDVAVHYRIDWLERAVIQAIASKLFTVEGRNRLSQRFEMEVARLLEDEVRRRGEIEKRLDELARMLKASLERTAGHASPLEDVVRASWNEETNALKEELFALREPAAFLAPSKALDGLSGRFDEMLSALPFRPQDAAGLALKQAFRDPIAEVRVFPPDGDGWIDLIIVIDLLASMRVRYDGSGLDDDDPLGREVLEVRYNVDEMRRHEWAERTEANVAASSAALADAASSAVYDLSDEHWDLIACLFDDVNCVVDGSRLDPRVVIDGLLCLAFTGGPLDRLPARYYEVGAFRRLAKRIVYAGAWDSVVATLLEACPEQLQDAELERFDTTDWPRMQSGALPPGADQAARDRAELLALAELEPEGDPVRLRLEAVADILSGTAIADAARRRGLTRPSVYHHWDKYKNRGGIEVLKRKERTNEAKRKLGDREIAMLGDIARTGVHPYSDEILTYPMMVDICASLFEVTFSRGGMIQLCRRNGFALQPFQNEARVRRNLARMPAEIMPPSTWSHAGRVMSLYVREGLEDEDEETVA